VDRRDRLSRMRRERFEAAALNPPISCESSSEQQTWRLFLCLQLVHLAPRIGLEELSALEFTTDTAPQS